MGVVPWVPDEGLAGVALLGGILGLTLWRRRQGDRGPRIGAEVRRKPDPYEARMEGIARGMAKAVFAEEKGRIMEALRLFKSDHDADHAKEFKGFQAEMAKAAAEATAELKGTLAKLEGRLAAVESRPPPETHPELKRLLPEVEAMRDRHKHLGDEVARLAEGLANLKAMLGGGRAPPKPDPRAERVRALKAELARLENGVADEPDPDIVEAGDESPEDEEPPEVPATPEPTAPPTTKRPRVGKAMNAGEWQDRLKVFFETCGEDPPPAGKVVKSLVARTGVFRCTTASMECSVRWPNSKNYTPQIFKGICEEFGYVRTREGQEIVFHAKPEE